MSLPTSSFIHTGVHYLNAISNMCMRVTGNKYSASSINNLRVIGDVQVCAIWSFRREGDETWSSSGTLRKG
jgi:hypothetical protein